jgi:hypothetical protein
MKPTVRAAWAAAGVEKSDGARPRAAAPDAVVCRKLRRFMGRSLVMAGSLRRGAGFKKGHRKLHAMSVPIYKILLFNELIVVNDPFRVKCMQCAGKLI